MSIGITSIREQSIHTGLPIIKVLGVGGGGGNVVNRMIEENIKGVEYAVANTDVMVLNSSRADVKVILGSRSSRGLGAGMKPEIGRAAAEEDQERIKEVLEGTDMVFIAAGMGGGTGTGAAPVIAEIAKEMKILTVGVVTTPFKFEGKKRFTIAERGIDELKKHVDTLMVIPNNKLLEIVSKDTPMDEAFAIADDVLKQAISGITNLINMEGIINLDFADVQTVMSNKGRAIMGTGIASGAKRGIDAATKAISSPLLSDKPISGAKGVIINIVADPSFSLVDAQAAAEYIESSADNEADVIFGFVKDSTKSDEVAITVIATGFEQSLEEKERTTERTSGRTQPLRVIDSLQHQTLEIPEKEEENVAPVEETILKEEKISLSENSIMEKRVEEKKEEEEEVLELESKYVRPVETELYKPEHLRNKVKSFTEQKKEEVDYDIPTFIRNPRVKPS